MKSYLILSWSLLLSAVLIAQPNPQNKKVTSTFYPDFEIEINTPAFAKKKGYTGYDEMMLFLNNLAKKHPEKMEISFIGESQKGKPIPIVKLNSKSEETDKIKMWLQGGLHGNEPGSSESMFYLIQQLLENPDMAATFNQLSLAIVPMANVDGYEKQDRYSANGLDLNRDQTKLAAPETQHLKKAYNDFRPEVAIDFHEYKPYRKDYARMGEFGLAGYYDAMFLYSGNLNVPENLRDFTERAFITSARKVLDSNQLTYHDYFSSGDYHGETHLNQGSNNARSSATNFALTNAVSTLIEVRGVGLGRTSFKRRIYTSFLIANSFFETAIQNKTQLRAEIAKANLSGHDAAIKMKKTISQETVKFIDVGSSQMIEITLTVHNANKMTATLQRPRPVAYIIESSQKEAIGKLMNLGLKLYPLEKPTTLDVESYTISEYDKEAEKYEGVNRQNVTTKMVMISKTFDVGAMVLPLDQQNANLAIEILEPETPNSMVSFQVIETKLNETLPYYRSLQPINLNKL
jgi:hypothetical protein